MATAADVAAYRSTQRDLVAVVLAELVAWWQELIASLTGDVPVAQIEAFTADLVAVYGDAAALAAADWYDELRDAAGVPGRFRARMADPAPAGQAAAVARWAAGPLFGAEPNPDQALEHLSGGVQRLVLQPARQTIADSVDQDPADARWARVPSGATTCAFCLVLASRGFAYHSRESAGDERKFHSFCDCQIVPDWGSDPRLEGYDPDSLLETYLAARRAAGSGQPSAILAELRRTEGIR